jgi:hypothetical protein
MRQTLPALIVALTVAASATASRSQGITPTSAASAPVTSASLPPQQAPVGRPVRPLTNLPSIVLQPEGSNKFPGEAFFEKAGKGTAVRIQSRLVQQTPMPAMIARGDCGKPGSRVYGLKPVVDGVSMTTLPNVTFDQLSKGTMTVRVELPRGKGDAFCGRIVAPEEPTQK